MHSFFRQFGWELARLAEQRRTRLGFLAAFAVEVLQALLLKFPSARLVVQADFRRVHVDYQRAFSGLTTASHIMGNSLMYVGIPFLALAAGELVAGELETGTLRMILSRPVGRGRLMLQKLLVCCCHAIVFTAFIAASSLAIGLALEGTGPLFILIGSESVFGTFDFSEGLQRYLLAATLLALTSLTIPLVALALSCFRMKPVTAAVVAITISVADGCIWLAPGFAAARPWLLTTRLVSWMHAFDNIVPSELIARNYALLLGLDSLTVIVAFAAFHRLEIKH